MEYLLELLLELLLEGGIEASKSTKVPKWIRYILIVFISLFFLGVIGVIFLTGILCLSIDFYMGIFFILIGILMLIMSILKFRKLYFHKARKKKLP